MKLTVSHIMKAYQGRTILRDCSFSFDRDVTYVLMGTNGSGKSTFLRICALLERQDSGEIAYTAGDTLLQQDMGLMRRITLVLPRIGVFNTTVFKNVAYGLNIRAVERKEMEERVRRTLAFVGLEKKRDQNALTLSSGETQRLGIARALVLEPEILFLDEPTASVDQENTEIIESIIGAMKKDGHTTVIMTTHDREQAERLADRLLVMKHGRIENMPST
jgi:tungstate transport system ATP-binding protein